MATIARPAERGRQRRRRTDRDGSHRETELELALLQVLLRERQKVALNRPLAGEEELEVLVLVLLEDLLDVLGRTLVLEPDLEDQGLLCARDGLGVDVSHALRRLERLRSGAHAETGAVRRNAVRRMSTTSVEARPGKCSPIARSSTRGWRFSLRQVSPRRRPRGQRTTAAIRPDRGPGCVLAVARRSVIDSGKCR
jgi:hypothetical protein